MLNNIFVVNEVQQMEYLPIPTKCDYRAHVVEKKQEYMGRVIRGRQNETRCKMLYFLFHTEFLVCSGGETSLLSLWHVK